MSKQRIIELQKSLKIAKTALERVSYGTTHAEAIAAEALDEMRLWAPNPSRQQTPRVER